MVSFKEKRVLRNFISENFPAFTNIILSSIKNLIKEVRLMLFLPRTEGQGMAEYAVILGLVAVVVVAILTVFGPQVGNMFSRVTRGFTQ